MYMADQPAFVGAGIGSKHVPWVRDRAAVNAEEDVIEALAARL